MKRQSVTIDDLEHAAQPNGDSQSCEPKLMKLSALEKVDRTNLCLVKNVSFSKKLESCKPCFFPSYFSMFAL